MPETQAGGVRIAYDAQGHGDAIVFVHALGSDRTVWASEMAAFGRDHRAIALDLRGHGGSGPASHAPTNAHALDINAVLDAERVARAHLVGLGGGAQAVLQFASEFPARVRSVTLAAYSGPAPGDLKVPVLTLEGGCDENFEAALRAFLKTV